MNEAKYYETGMKVSYDPRKKSVSVIFRGKIAVLEGPYATEKDAIQAGENYCRARGWKGGPPDPRGGRSMLPPATGR